jgi:hypothetical protein
MCDPLLVDWPWGPMASLLRDKDIQEKLPSRKTNLRKIIDSTHLFSQLVLDKCPVDIYPLKVSQTSYKCEKDT